MDSNALTGKDGTNFVPLIFLEEEALFPLSRFQERMNVDTIYREPRDR